MSRFVHATSRYFLLVLGPGADGGFVAADDAGEDDQCPDQLVRRGDAPGGALEQGVHPAVRRPGAGQRLQDVRASLHGDVMHDHEEHAPGLQAQPVRNRSRRAGHSARWRRDVHLPAHALHRVPVMLDRLCLDIRGDVSDLMRGVHAQVGGLRQVPPAPARARREVRDRVVGIVAPCQVRPGSAGLLTRTPLPAGFLTLFRRHASRQVISRRRHRRVPAVTRQQPFQARQALLQVRDLRRQRRLPLPQPGNLLITSGTARTTRDSSRYTGHKAGSSAACSEQADTPGRLPGTEPRPAGSPRHRQQAPRPAPHLT